MRNSVDLTNWYEQKAEIIEQAPGETTLEVYDLALTKLVNTRRLAQAVRSIGHVLVLVTLPTLIGALGIKIASEFVADKMIDRTKDLCLILNTIQPSSGFYAEERSVQRGFQLGTAA